MQNGYMSYAHEVAYLAADSGDQINNPHTTPHRKDGAAPPSALVVG